METLGILLLSEWDVLAFLYRRGTSLASAEQMAQLLGYGKGTIGNALEKLEMAGWIQRSRASQGVRLYAVSFPNQSFQQLMRLSDQRALRLLVSQKLKHSPRRKPQHERTGLHLA